MTIIGYDAQGRPVRQERPQQQTGRVIGFDAQGRPVREAARMGALQAFGSGAADAVTFGFGDELQGVLFGDEARDEARRRQELARAERPGMFLAGQVGGSLVGGGGVGVVARGALGATRLANAARAIGPIGRLGVAGVTGGAGGSLYAAGDSPDEMRLQNAINGFVPGMAFGVAGQGIGEVAGRVMGAVGRSMSPEARAGREMAQTLERFGPQGATPQAVEQNVLRALQDAPDNAMVGDIVPGMPSLVRAAGVRPSREREALRQAFDARNNEMGDRAIDDLWSTLAPGAPRNAARAIESIAQTQRQTARPLYNAIMNKPVDPRRANQFLGEIIRRNPRLFNSARRDAQELMMSEHGTVFNQNDPRFWHYLQQGADQVFERLRKTQGGLSGNERRVFGRALDAYRIQLRRLLGPEFGRAQDVWSSGARQREAVELGFDAADDRLDDLRLGEVVQSMRRMTRGEREMMQLGVISRLSNMIRTADRGTGRADVLRSVLANKGQRQVLETLFGGSSKFNEVVRRLETQRQLFQSSVESGIGVNSHTADRLLAADSLQARTTPTGIRDAVVQMLTRDAADRFDESVSNEILQTAGLNANQVAREVAQAGGFRKWTGGRGLISRAIRERQRAIEQRPKALVDALALGLYAPTAGGAATEYGY